VIAPPLARTRLVLAALVFTACRPAGSQGFPAAEQRARTAAHARVAVTSAPQAEFATITGIDSDTRGRIFVADWMQKRVTVLSPGGRVLRTLGTVGSGPGEFRAMRGLQVLPGDSLAVYDPELARVTVYEPQSLRVAATVSLGPRLHGPAPFRVTRLKGGGFVALFRSGFTFNGGVLAPRRDSVAVLRPDGTPAATIARVPPRPFLRSGFSMAPNPFGREPLVAADSRGHALYVWTDSLAVQTFSDAGAALGRFAVPYQPPRVQPRDVDGELAAMDDYGRRTFRQALADSVPGRWPAVRDLLVDDAGRVWLGLAGPRGAAREWAVFTPQGAYLRSVMVPGQVTLRAVRRGRLYGDQSNDDGVPSVVVLTLDRGLQ
jgi:hypothetical protein